MINKKIIYYIIGYILLISIFSLYLFKNSEITTFKIAIFLLLIILSIFSIIYYNFNKKNIHKVALIIILIFGIICLFTTPICDVSDEAEHFIRSSIVSTGEISTDYVPIPNTNLYGYKTIASTQEFFYNHGENVFESETANLPINYTESYVNSAFSQNPFYGYLPQAIGILIAELFSLNAIWMLWLGRLSNLIVYSIICTIAIKKAPKFKLALLATACLPLAIYQGASTSIDGIINGFGILAIGYFISMYYTKENSLKWIDISIFYISILIIGLIKFPYLFLGFLIFIIPPTTFKNKTQETISKIIAPILLIVGVIWNMLFTSKQLENSWRGEYFKEHNVSPEGQIQYIKENPQKFTLTSTQMVYNFPNLFSRFFEFSNGVNIYSSKLLGYSYLIVFWITSLFYPLKEKIKTLDKIKTFIIVALIYLSTIAIQYLSWAKVGSDYILSGVFPRYFIPLLILIPFIFNLTNNFKINKELDTLIITLILFFISGMIMLTIAFNY